MMLRASLLVVCLVAGGASAATQAPVFSSRVDAVRVDVLVTDRGDVVRGLQAHDFEVLDNGVPQQVDLVAFERLPLKVMLALDMSDSVAGERLTHLRSAGLTLLEQLAPDDEAGLVTFSHVVTLDAPLGTDRRRVRAALEKAQGFGRTSLIDASYAGMAVGESGIGRSLLIVFSDGVDTSSWMSAASVLDAAKRSDVVVYCVSLGRAPRRGFTAELTSLTGGALIEIESTRDLGPTFLRILDEFRQRYLLSYTPRGVALDGWHRLEVRVKGRRATVRTRPGYFAIP